MVGGAYRSWWATCIEVRLNPANRNRGGEWDLDHVILPDCRAVLETYPTSNLRTGVFAGRDSKLASAGSCRQGAAGTGACIGTVEKVGD